VKRIENVYVAGPYSAPTEAGVLNNVDIAIATGDRVASLGLGLTPFIPHLNFIWNQRHPHPYRFWMEYCFSWLKRCDALLRIPGSSPGSEEEVVLATKLGIPVFYSIEELIEAVEAQGVVA
jgi:hypothetical protein